MDFFENTVNILKVQKRFIIYSSWEGVEFLKSLDDILKNVKKSLIIHPG